MAEVLPSGATETSSLSSQELKSQSGYDHHDDHRAARVRELVEKLDENRLQLIKYSHRLNAARYRSSRLVTALQALRSTALQDLSKARTLLSHLSRDALRTHCELVGEFEKVSAALEVAYWDSLRVENQHCEAYGTGAVDGYESDGGTEFRLDAGVGLHRARSASLGSLERLGVTAARPPGRRGFVSYHYLDLEPEPGEVEEWQQEQELKGKCASSPGSPLSPTSTAIAELLSPVDNATERARRQEQLMQLHSAVAEVRSLFAELQQEVAAQHQSLDTIEQHVGHAVAEVCAGRRELVRASEYQGRRVGLGLAVAAGLVGALLGGPVGAMLGGKAAMALGAGGGALLGLSAGKRIHGRMYRHAEAEEATAADARPQYASPCSSCSDVSHAMLPVSPDKLPPSATGSSSSPSWLSFPRWLRRSGRSGSAAPSTCQSPSSSLLVSDHSDVCESGKEQGQTPVTCLASFEVASKSLVQSGKNKGPFFGW